MYSEKRFRAILNDTSRYIVLADGNKRLHQQETVPFSTSGTTMVAAGNLSYGIDSTG